MNLKDHVVLVPGKNFIKIKVVPNSAKTELLGIMGNNVLKISAKGVPEKGKVNIEIIKFLSQELGIKKDRVVIVTGATSKTKLVRIDFL